MFPSLSPHNSLGKFLPFAAERRTLLWFSVILLLTIGFPSCIPREFSTGSTRRRQVLSITRVLHSDGARFKPIYTDTDMCDPALRQEIEEAVEEINKLKDISPPLPEDWELALELGKDEETGESICSYYFVCHSTRCLFWLHEFDLESVLNDLCGVTQQTHIREPARSSRIHLTKRMTRSGIASSLLVGGHQIATTTSCLTISRSHWEMFPHNREVPEPLVQELTGLLLHAGIGTLEPVLDVL